MIRSCCWPGLHQRFEIDALDERNAPREMNGVSPRNFVYHAMPF